MRSRREGEAPAEPQRLGRSLALPINNQFNVLAISEKCQKIHSEKDFVGLETFHFTNPIHDQAFWLID